MALSDALLVVAEMWPDLRERVEPARLERARRLLAAAVHGASWEPDELLDSLLGPEPLEHPAWQALIHSPERQTAHATLPVPLAAARLRLVVERDLEWRRTSTEETAVSDPDRVDAEAEARLWAVPLLAVEVIDRPSRTMLVLERDGHHLAPAFQFDSNRELLTLAAEVNDLLGADDDPWGVASWWLTPHAALHGIPADELRTGAQELVLAAAHAAGPVQ
jgi:hypothetical protein